MTRLRRRLLLVPVLLAGLLLSGACSKDKGEEARKSRPNKEFNPGVPRPGTTPPGEEAGKSRPIKEIMIKLNEGPQSLTEVLSQELAAASPDWGTIHPQTKEFATLAATLSKHTPPKGSKESWARLTKDYADSAAALEKAAQARDRTAAQNAHKALANSCMGCHREHRTLGGPGGG